MDQKSITGEGFLFFAIFVLHIVSSVPKLPYSLKVPPLLGCEILSWCVSEPHSYPQRNSTRHLGFNYPARRPLPSNTVHLPAGSLLPSIPNKPENRRSSDPIRQKIKKKTTPFSNTVQNQKKDGQQERDGVIRRNSRKKSKTAAITGAIKKD